jgi:hypothetical protein
MINLHYWTTPNGHKVNLPRRERPCRNNRPILESAAQSRADLAQIRNMAISSNQSWCYGELTIIPGWNEDIESVTDPTDSSTDLAARIPNGPLRDPNFQ